jgi:hypothetical protein
MSVLGKTAGVALLSFSITMAVMALVSQVPGLEVPLAWWMIGGILPLAISIPVIFLMARQADDIRRLNAQLMLAYEFGQARRRNRSSDRHRQSRRL